MPLASPSSWGVFLFVLVISWPSCSLHCPCACFTFSSAFYPLRVFVGLSSLLRRWLSSLGASLPSVLCLAAVVCASCRIHLPLFTAAFFFLSWPCLFLFFPSAVSFCCALPLFFLRWYTSFQGFSALVFGRSLGSSVPMRYSLLLSVVWGRCLCFPFPLSFVSVVHLPLLVGWLFSFSGFLPLRILLGFLVVVLLWGFLPLLSCLSRSLVYFRSLGALLPRSNLRFLPRQGPPFGPSQLPFGFSELLLVPLSCACLLASLRWSPSASLFLLLQSWSSLPVGLFFLGVRATPLPWVSRMGFGLSALLVLLWFSLAVFALVLFLLSSRLPLPSGGSSLMLFCFGGLCLPSCMSCSALGRAPYF